MNRQRTKGCSIVESVEHSFEPQFPAQAFMCDDERSAEASEAVALDAHCDARQMVRLVQCPRCSKPLSAPVTLPCGHTVCRGCLPPPQPRTNISYPNTPDRLMGISCPLMGCGAEHASAECSVDVTLTKLMDLIKAEIIEHRPSAENTPTLLVEVPQHEDSPLDEKEKEKLSYHGNQEELHGGRLVSTFTMAEMGKLRYSSEVHYQSLSASGDDYEHLDITLLERLRDVTHKELDCLVCYNLMLDPTTTSCGHTFCRRCLARVMDHSSICPFCRRGLHVPASLQNQSSNVILNSLLNGLCPDLVSARADALKAEEQAGDNVLNVPLFICTLSLPSMPTFLHVFEPRYRLMMRRVIEGSRQFGMVMYNRTHAPQGDLGSTPFLEYGTLLEIVNYELLRDGRSFIETRGKDLPLYLEWAPEDILSEDPTYKKDENDTSILGEHETKRASLEQELEGTTNADIDTERVESRSLFVKNLNFKTTDESLKKHFVDHVKKGKLRSVRIKKHVKNGKNVSMGFGFLEFDTVDTALQVSRDLQGTVLDGHALMLQLCHAKNNERVKDKVGDDESSTKLIVRNVAFEATEKELRQLFSTFGQIKSLRLPAKYGKHRGFAFVEFVTKQETKNALQALSSSHLYGRHLVLERAKEGETLEDLRARTAAKFVDESKISLKRKQRDF